ncbi:hypothetical protein SAY87_001094 [Trapa incisa]|uniref:non-specific serine/threonine protein kinase n=1 Tax=Trapa incisa TaxID=236973 RepID=A0AAN7JHL2_9MYRT|nr:hypothetical protein SAY87_001094 [Trapa incisa]
MGILSPSLLWVFMSMLILHFLTAPVESQLQSPPADLLFTNGFAADAANLTLNGGAQVLQNGVLRLTNDSLRALGHAFYSTPVRFKNSFGGPAASFSTAFAFSTVPQYPGLGGHGLAFTISRSRDLPRAHPSQYLGLMNASDIGNFSNHIFAVEFDTVKDFEFDDIDDNHIGIDINSLVSNASVTAGYFADNSSTIQDIHLQSGEVIQAWVDYDSLRNQLDVRISESSVKPTRAILSFNVDLSEFFEETMFVGFSASTGLLASYHYIMGWSFSVNGEAKSLDLSSLPSSPGSGQNTHKGLILGVSVSASVIVVILLASIAIYVIHRIRTADAIEAWELDVGPHRFPYRELKKATQGFREKELLGFGGFGRVYRGTLLNSNTRVAVKRILNRSKQGLQEFVTEINIIGRLRHRNLVQLLGWCRRRNDLLLVYEFMSNGSLDKYLFDEPKRILSWEERFKIIKGVASVLLYLHEEGEQSVIHRDIKAANVLLDDDLNGKLGDFGLAKLYEHGADPSTTRVVGTLGYLAPELTKTGKPSASSDVFSFGALMLEVVCGRRPIEQKAMPEELILVDWVWENWVLGSILQVVDPRLGGQFDEVEAVLLLKLGLICSNRLPEIRPSMRYLVRYLEGDLIFPDNVLPPDGNYDIKNTCSGNSGCDGGPDYIRSYQNSSSSDKATSSSTANDGDLDLEAGPFSPAPSDSGNSSSNRLFGSEEVDRTNKGLTKSNGRD